jgi:ABC-type iron transport system FetAB ATPase subunit
MRVTRLEVQNFRALAHVLLDNLGDTVVLAGPNGCGKSCVFDAFRFLKSASGGYDPNEWQQWFSEFQINFTKDRGVLRTLFRDSRRPLRVAAQVEIHPDEREYLRAQGEELLERIVWREVAPHLEGAISRTQASLSREMRAKRREAREKAQAYAELLLRDLEKDSAEACIQISPDLEVSTHESVLIDLLFSSYDPAHLGVFDFNGANRTYNREQIGGINLNLEASKDRLKQSALYNYTNKYNNIKAELASEYVKGLIAEARGGAPNDNRLATTLRSLFATFFPGKEFVGVQPTEDNTLEFLVRLPDGTTHDVNDLSSGEKEVLFGYLRIRDSAPKNSVVLLDEPELHLNPRLLLGLPQFYHQHLGKELGNQLWLITHSDSLLRQAVGLDGFSVFHMRDAISAGSANQAEELTVGDALRNAIIDLVGDLAAYRPSAKVVIFEGEDSEFDLDMTTKLFPRVMAEVTGVSARKKAQVRRVHDLLEVAARRGGAETSFFSVVDRDDSEGASPGVARRFTWDVYHIENYLLDPRFILAVLDDLGAADRFSHGGRRARGATRRCAANGKRSRAPRAAEDGDRSHAVGHSRRSRTRCAESGTTRTRQVAAERSIPARDHR